MRAIQRDLNRTFPEHSFFKESNGLGQEGLLNILKAYSIYDREVGYCQGSPFITGLLLMKVCLHGVLLQDMHCMRAYIYVLDCASVTLREITNREVVSEGNYESTVEPFYNR